MRQGPSPRISVAEQRSFRESFQSTMARRIQDGLTEEIWRHAERMVEAERSRLEGDCQRAWLLTDPDRRGSLMIAVPYQRLGIDPPTLGYVACRVDNLEETTGG